MAPKQILPDDDVLKALRRQGWTYADIAQEYGVTEAGVYKRLRAAGVTRSTKRRSDFLPWRIKTSHTFARPAEMLRYLARRNSGEALTAVRERQLDRWLAQIREKDVVVCYDPDMGPNPASPKYGGFYYSRRRPEDGESLIRVEPSRLLPGQTAGRTR